MVSRNRKIIAAAVVVALVAVGVTLGLVNRGGSSPPNQTVIFSRVQTRTLQSTVALNGTLSRKQIRNVDAATTGLVSAVYSKNGSTTQAGQSMFAVNGRDAIAENGTVPFFRSLQAGDQGADVLQLKQILTAAGDDPGPMTNYFNGQTEYALAQWQAQHGYPNSTPANPESVTVSLEQGTNYKLGAQSSAGLIIGPPAAQTTASTTGSTDRTHAADATLASYVAKDTAAATPVPVLTIQSVDDKVPQGQPATFVVSASTAPSSPVVVDLSTGGTAGSQDIVTPPQSAILEAGATSATFAVQTRVNTLVEKDPTVVVSITAGTGYTIGTPASAQTTIANNNVPALQITGGTTVAPGAAATLTVTANQAPLENIQVGLSFGGSAQQGTDYDPVNPVLTLSAGSTSATITINTLAANVIEPAKYIVVSIAQSPASYTVTSPGVAVVTLSGSTAKPTATLTSATTYLQKGEPFQVTVGLSEAVSTAVTIHLKYGGTAVQGTDYTAPAGSIVIPAGETSLPISIPTVTNNIVEPNRVLTVSLAPNTGYVVGTPSSASVTIASSVVPTLTIAASTTTIAQGGAASFVITASQAPVKNTTVTFAVEGTAQPSQNYVPLTGTTLLAAGQTQVTVVLQSIQNNVVFQPTDMIVGHWPIRVGQVNVKAGAPVQVGEAILSLTEPDLSVTLQATAAERSKLKVGQPCTVEIAGENTESSGVITQLNATPTSVAGTSGQAQQLYEGRIEVSGLTGADGSQVSITVVNQQVTNALTVPIAAVKQNGTGGDVVRVINLGSPDHGKITEVPVKTGLTEGSYIQITKGLRLNQVVIAQVDHS
jgi:hypothetical protein